MNKVYLIGAGPGDQELLTIKGRRILEQADTVIYDALVGDGVLSLIPTSAVQISVGKRSGCHSRTQEEINRILVEEGKKGGIVVRLKGGDPFVFGRGGEEILALREQGIPFEVVPGIPSPTAVLSYGGIPVTHRGLSSSFHVFTGHFQQEESWDFPTLARLEGTLVFLMGVSAAETICQGLQRAGMKENTPAAFVQEGTTASQKTVVSTLMHIVEDGKKAGIQAPAILAVGEVCRLASELSWVEQKPLHGVRILVTRPGNRAGRLAGRLREAGAEVLELPSVETVRFLSNPDLEAAFDRLEDYHWLVFTSPSGVEYFFEELKERKLDVRMLQGKKIAVIGTATGEEFLRRGVIPDYMPGQAYGRCLGEGLAGLVEPSEGVLLLRAKAGSRELTEYLNAAGIRYTDVPLYHTEYPPTSALTGRVRERLAAGTIDCVTFTSGSTVSGFLKRLQLSEKELLGVTAVCIGTETERAARQAGMRTLCAARPSIDSMVDCILEEFHRAEP